MYCLLNGAINVRERGEFFLRFSFHYGLEGNISGHFSQKFDVFQSDFEASPYKLMFLKLQK